MAISRTFCSPWDREPLTLSASMGTGPRSRGFPWFPYTASLRAGEKRLKVRFLMGKNGCLDVFEDGHSTENIHNLEGQADALSADLCGGNPPISSPLNMILPLSGFRWPVMSLNRVLFPAPLGR